jgi:hypothetical protein
MTCRFEKLPAGWDRVDEEVISMVDTVLKKFRADPVRVYLTGVARGFGSFHLASSIRDDGLVATIVATGRLEDAQNWLNHICRYGCLGWKRPGSKTALALWDGPGHGAGRAPARFAVHEDMDHDAGNGCMKEKTCLTGCFVTEVMKDPASRKKANKVSSLAC